MNWLITNHYYMHGGGLVIKSCPTLAIPWTVACQAPLSMGFSRREYWSGLSFPSPEDLPNPGIEPVLLHCRQIPYRVKSYYMYNHHKKFRTFNYQRRSLKTYNRSIVVKPINRREWWREKKVGRRIPRNRLMI